MYEITICRKGNYRIPIKKRCFKKEFNTLDEIVRFYLKANNKLYCPYIFKEISKRELRILSSKLNSQLMLSR